MPSLTLSFFCRQRQGEKVLEGTEAGHRRLRRQLQLQDGGPQLGGRDGGRGRDRPQSAPQPPQRAQVRPRPGGRPGGHPHHRPLQGARHQPAVRGDGGSAERSLQKLECKRPANVLMS